MAEVLMKSGQVQKDEFNRPVRIQLFLDTDTDVSYGEIHIQGMHSFSKYPISSSLVVKAEPGVHGEVLAQGMLQSNGFWNFILTDTREPFSATGFKDLYDAEMALLKYLVLKDYSVPMEPVKHPD